jgi:hypothetical protein
VIRVDKLIEKLKEFPPDSYAYAYEAEVVGIVIVKNLDEYDELGTILASGYMREE